jgi:hypothetical protein
MRFATLPPRDHAMEEADEALDVVVGCEAVAAAPDVRPQRIHSWHIAKLAAELAQVAHEHADVELAGERLGCDDRRLSATSESRLSTFGASTSRCGSVVGSSWW